VYIYILFWHPAVGLLERRMIHDAGHTRIIFVRGGTDQSKTILQYFLFKYELYCYYQNVAQPI
jgi:hypothetical protein